MLSLRGYRKNVQGLPDLLPYVMLADRGVMVNKDGSLMAAWEFRGQDTASSTEEELDQAAYQVNQALMSLGTGWMMHVDALRRPATGYPEPGLSQFGDEVSALIDEERRAFFARASCFETTTILTLTYKPSYSVTTGLLGDRQTFEKSLTEFKAAIDNFEDLLASVLELERLEEYQDEDEHGQKHGYSTFLAYIQQCLTGDFQPVRLPGPCAMYLDGLLGGQDLVTGFEPKIGDKYLLVLSIDGFPLESCPSILEVLSGLPLPYRFNSRFIALDQLDAVKATEDYRKGWTQQIFGFLDKYFKNPNARANRDAAIMAEDAERAKADAQSGLISFGFLSSTVVLMHEDLDFLRERAKYVKREIARLGFNVRVERHNAVEAWLGSLPGNWKENVRRPLVSTLNMAHFMPLSSIWPGAAECPCPFYPPESPPLMVCTTDGSTPFRFNLHVGDLGHTLILGPTGAGKSTFLALICAQFQRYRHSQVFVFDKGLSMLPLCLGVGGAHYDLGEEDSALAFSPLRRIHESEAEMAWACDWLAGLLEVQGVKLEPRELEAIAIAVGDLRSQPELSRPLNHFMALMPQNSRLRAGLAQYCRYRDRDGREKQGPAARLLDANDDRLGLSDFMVFEIEELMNMGEKSMIPVLLYLFHRLEKALDGRPSLLVLDEAWLMLGNPVFRNKIREWLKVLRKANCAVVLATQSLSDAARSEILDVLAESCPTKVFLPNFEAGNETQREQYKGLGLNSKQIQIIAHGTPKRDYYVTARGAGRREMRLALGPKTLAFVGAGSKEDIAQIRNLHAHFGAEWTREWLRYKRALD